VVQLSVKELRENRVLFGETILGLEFHEGQKKLLACDDRFIACRASRRFGKSFVFAAFACHMAATNENCRIVCLSKTKFQSQELFQKIYIMIKNSPLVDYLSRNTLSRIELTNGSVIESLPGRSASSLRGPTINLILIDEAAYVSTELFEAVYPTILNVRGKKTGKMVMISSPRFASGEFYKAFQPGSIFTPFHFTYKDTKFANGELLLPEEEIEREAQRCGGRSTAYFLKEYMAEFGASDDLFFDLDGVEKSLKENLPQIKYAMPDHKYVIAADLAVKHDYTVFIVLDYTDKSNLKIVNHVRFNGKSPDQIMDELYKLTMAFRPNQVLIDDGNIGAAVVSQLKVRYPGQRWNGFNFSSTSKVPLMTDLNIAMCTGILQIPEDDQIREELVSFYYEENQTTGHLKLNGSGSHDDYPIAIALAIRAANIFTRRGDLVIGSDKGILTGGELSKCYKPTSYFV